MHTLVHINESTDLTAEVSTPVPSLGQASSSVVTYAFFDAIPASFFAGLEDVASGRVLDMERALNEPPPPHV
jgi:hypothetical protein